MTLSILIWLPLAISVVVGVLFPARLVGRSVAVGGLVTLGVAISFLARTALVHKFPTLRLSGTFEGYWPFKAAAIALFGAAIGAVYPAFKAARKDPIDALAYE